MAMRQYANTQQSGTVASSVGRRETIDNVVDRVMMIAERLVKLEKVVENQNLRINQLTQELAEAKKAKATTPARKTTAKPPKSEEPKLIMARIFSKSGEVSIVPHKKKTYQGDGPRTKSCKRGSVDPVRSSLGVKATNKY